MGERLSLTDFKILNYLLESDVSNYNKMAAQTGIPASTIYDRLKKMRQNGFIERMAPVLNLEKLGYSVFASLEIEVYNMREVDSLKDKISSNPNIVGLFKMSGNYDLLALTVFRQPSDLEKLINELLKQKEVKDVHGNLSIHTYKFLNSPQALRED
jgi:Lrp/AsnC family transcriptional regulator for asnA, asnC and gidA